MSRSRIQRDPPQVSTDRAAGCGGHHRPMSETASDNLPDCAAVPKSALGPALTAKAFDARRALAFAWRSR
jgi:hypothetical protein